MMNVPVSLVSSLLMLTLFYSCRCFRGGPGAVCTLEAPLISHRHKLFFSKIVSVTLFKDLLSVAFFLCYVLMRA